MHKYSELHGNEGCGRSVLICDPLWQKQKLQSVRLCVIRKIDCCVVQQLRHQLKYVFALKPDANYKHTRKTCEVECGAFGW
jgi:hypothetical protein